MASVVPYTGIPSVAPEQPATPTRQINAPIEAFGGAVAQATQHLGQVEASAGDELFARANALQQINETANASKAVSDYTMALGDAYTTYTSKRGSEAVDGYKDFQSSVESLRQQYRDTLNSPFAGRLYDQESRSMMSRTVFSAARHAGDQLAVYNKSAGDARIGASLNQIGLLPGDDKNFADNLNIVEQATRSGMTGQPQEAVDLAVSNAKSGAWATRIRGVADKDPVLAGQWLKTATDGKSMNVDDLDKATKYVTQQQQRVIPRRATQAVLGGSDTSFGDKVVAPELARAAIAGNEQDGRGYATQGPTVTDANGNSGNGLGRYQIMSYNLQPWLKEAGMQSMTPQQFLADGQAQDQLFDFKFGQYQQKYGSWNLAAKAWFGGEGNVNADMSKGDGFHSNAWYISKGNATLASLSPRSVVAAHANATGQAMSNIPGTEKDIGDASEQHVLTKLSADDRNRRDDTVKNLNAVGNAALTMDKDGKFPTELDQLFDGKPENQTAFNNLDAQGQQSVRDQLAKNAADPFGKTQQNQTLYRQTMGALLDPNKSAAEIDAALKRNPMVMNLPNKEKLDIFKQQQKIQAGIDDPDLKDALTTIQQVYPDAVPRKSNGANADNTEYNTFILGLSKAVTARQDETKKPISDDEKIKIGATLLQQTDSGHWYTSDPKRYLAPIPDEEKENITRVFTATNGRAPSPIEVQAAWGARLAYEQLYNQPKKKSP